MADLDDARFAYRTGAAGLMGDDVAAIVAAIAEG
jgi:hypothetical protein